MPSLYRNDRHRLWAEIVARVEAGETLQAICAMPGLPSTATVNVWARADALFGAELAAAQGRAAWRRMWVLDEAKAAAFLARARAGEGVMSLLSQPGMPTPRQYRRWKILDPTFGEAVFALVKRRNAQLADHGRAQRRDFDQAVADRIVGRLSASRLGPRLREFLKAHPDLPGIHTVSRWRRERPKFDAALKLVMAHRRWRGRPVPKARIKAVTDHIVEGGSFASYSRTPGGPSQGTLTRWMRDPAFAEAVDDACEKRGFILQCQLDDAAQEVPPGPIRQMNRAIAPLTRRMAGLWNRPQPPRWRGVRKE